MSKCERKLIDVWGYNPSIKHMQDYQGFPNSYDGLFYYLLSSSWTVVVDETPIVSYSSEPLMSIIFSGSPWYYDTNYFMNRSGSKVISPLVDRVSRDEYGGNNGVLTSVGRGYIATILLRQFVNKWNKIQQAFGSSYNPIHNYNMNESTRISGTDNTELTHGKKISLSTSRNDNGTGKVYGFNSSSAVNANQATTSSSGTDTTTASGTDSTNNTKNETITVTRSGNIGVTTTQQMLESELELRKNNIIDIIFSDIDKILTLPIY